MNSRKVRNLLLLSVAFGGFGCSSSPRAVNSSAAPNVTSEPAVVSNNPNVATAIEAKKEIDMSTTQSTDSFHALATHSLDGQPVKLSDFKGKVVLVVNTASECGLTPQYAGLEKLHTEFAAKGFSVLGFPSNDFGAQEPGTAEQIQTFCTSRYGVTFPLFNKVQTKSGDAQSPVYAWLHARTNQLPRWNFGKYLISKDGTQVQFFDSKIPPEDPTLRAAIERALVN